MQFFLEYLIRGTGRRILPHNNSYVLWSPCKAGLGPKDFDEVSNRTESHWQDKGWVEDGIVAKEVGLLGVAYLCVLIE